MTVGAHMRPLWQEPSADRARSNSKVTVTAKRTTGRVAQPSRPPGLAHFVGSIDWLGISGDPVFLGEPETGGCAEHWIGTLKSSACGRSCTPLSTSCTKPSVASSTAPPPRGRSVGTAIYAKSVDHHSRMVT